MGWQGCVPFDILADCSAILCHRMQHPQGREKKGGKTEELCLGKPEMVSDLPRGHLLLSGDTADTMCN